MARIHSIIAITQGGLLYRDVAEIPRWIDFRQCYDVFCAEYSTTITVRVGNGDMRCVGRHCFHLAPLAYVEFYTDPLTRLEFENHEQLWDLLKQMRLHGSWFAINVD
ncbi:MAG: hypothetical protein L0154_11700 [Chloroflexi bacterium]|nr:hypothetical protein [Chloroflexota bacterium]